MRNKRLLGSIPFTVKIGPFPLLIILLFLVGVACGGKAAPATSAPTSPSGTPGATLAPAVPSTTGLGQAQRGGTLLRLGDDPPTLDPHLATDTTSSTYVVEVFGGLVTLSPKLEIVPDLAESWDVSPDRKTYTFHLRTNVKFHDGKPVTAQDFKWSFERVADPKTQSPVVDNYLGDVVGVKDKLKGEATEVKGVQAIDERTLRITIDAPKAYFLAKLTYPTAFVLDRKNVEGNPKWLKAPNGTGPFKLTKYSPGETLVLTRNADYHLGPANLDEVQFILSGGDAMLMYENEEIHLTGVSLVQLDAILDSANPLNKDVQKAPPGFDVEYVGMNVTQAPFDDLKVRQAFNYAVDKTKISHQLLKDLVAPATGVLPPGFPGYNPNFKGYEYNPEKARQLLRDSKYGKDKLPPITLTVPGAFGATVGPAMEAMLEMWRQNLGVEVQVQQTEWATYLQDLHKRRFQMFGGLGWIADYPDPENFLDLLFHTGSTNNQAGYANPDVDRLLDQARVEPDQNARYDLYHRAEQAIIGDAPWVPLWYSGGGYLLLKPYVKDFFLTPLVIPNLRYVYLTNAKACAKCLTLPK